MRFEFNERMVECEPKGDIPAIIENGKFVLDNGDIKINANDVTDFSNHPMPTINGKQLTVPLKGKPQLKWNGSCFTVQIGDLDVPVHAIGYIQTLDPLFTVFKYKGEQREGEIYPITNPPRWGIPYSGYALNGNLYLMRSNNERQALPPLPTGEYEKGPIPLIYHKGEWSMFVAPKTFKVKEINDLQISTSPITAKQHGLHPCQASQGIETDSGTSSQGSP